MPPTARRSPDLIVQKELRSIRKSVASIDDTSEVRNRLQVESFYHQYNLQVISGLQWSLNVLSNVNSQDIGVRTLENQLPSDSSVPAELQDVVVHGHSHVIERYNSIAQMCGVQMKNISSQYGLGKGFGGRVPLLNQYGELDLEGDLGSGTKRKRDEEVGTAFGPSKRVRIGE
ncbi:hypothetical protein M422DRAFT_265946 [Sphaerobolus stellatus SS14]|uniref:Uncharacterized protein n=1 Tax=Sphaerobolus stellatus (strain SS14) TaxID=990650 RepID=A0A0C9USR5_SPHS4|nr:hypothetical protein M422DRAFT_265946 [Sphaerobolus stellatus SS14]